MSRVRAWGIGAVAVLALAGCSGGANINPLTIGKSDPFCTDLATFQGKAAALEAASTNADLPTVRADVTVVSAALATLNTDAAKLPDKVNGHFVRDDLAVAASTYSALKDSLAAAKDGDPNALVNALAAVQSKEGQAFTTSTGRLDSYTKKACNLVVSTPTTTVPSSTTVPVVGPVGPTTSTATPTTTPATTSQAPTTAP